MSNEIIVTSQEEWDNLPDKFEILTFIIVKCNFLIIKKNPTNSYTRLYENSYTRLYENSSAELYDNSSAELYGNSSAELDDNSSARLYGNSFARLYENSSAKLYGNSSARLYNNSSARLYNNSSARLYDNSSARLYENSSAKLYDNSSARLYGKTVALNFSKNTTINNFDISVIVDRTMLMPEISFETWIERGMVVCDGIYRELVSSKTIGNVTIYETDNGYVAKIGDKTAHGETVEQAKNDLRYKISDRDTSKYNSWSINDVKPTDEIIEAYMTITGACSMGTKEFCERLQLKDEYKISEIFEITDNAYGSDKFKEFFTK